VPDPVYALLREVARRTPHALTVVLERDGLYPPIAELIAELDRAREALKEGRGDRITAHAPAPSPPSGGPTVPQAVLARLYVEPGTRERFLADPLSAARDLRLAPDAAAALAAIDRDGLRLAASSFARKREGRHTA
jgi:hypothetical protein